MTKYGKEAKEDPELKMKIDAVLSVCKALGISIAHEDHQGAFQIDEWSEGNANWLREAIDVREGRPEVRSLALLGLPEGGRKGAIEQVERKTFTDALVRAGGNRLEAARLLGVSVDTLQRKMRALGLRKQFPARAGRPKSAK